ncbi:hypothetical protein L6164_025703 [Bauhinia variegata]|uniref:Uncharacterized protein n=1 Tax=Bauhinia variegata TaxID=167791 RepID=A0ACB9M1B8_BAUVA|nr:hypothetical protein L6164_025703 [Bauhinia variegata]
MACGKARLPYFFLCFLSIASLSVSLSFAYRELGPLKEHERPQQHEGEEQWPWKWHPERQPGRQEEEKKPERQDPQWPRGREGEDQKPASWDPEKQMQNPYHYRSHRFQTRYRSEYGHIRTLPRFSSTKNLRALENYRLIELQSRPQTFILPHHSDAEYLIVVVDGKIPAGATVYAANRDDNRNLRVVKLATPVNDPEQFEDFFPGGQENNPQSYFNGFSRQILEAAFDAPYQEIQTAVLGHQSEQEEQSEGGQSQGQNQGVIVRASMEQIRQLIQRAQSSQQVGQSQSGPFNLRNLQNSYTNNYGRFWEARPEQLPQLQNMDVSITLTELNRGALLLPHFSTKAILVAYIAQGNGHLEIASPRRRSSYPFSIRASSNNNLRFVGFNINAENHRRSFLTGQGNNMIEQMDMPAKELTFRGSGEQVERLLRLQKQSFFASGQPQQQRQREGREDGKVSRVPIPASIFSSPHHSDAHKLVVVVSGRALFTIVNGNNRESYNLERGDVLRIPAGATTYAANRDDNRNLRVIKLAIPVNNPGQFVDFFPGGQQNPQSYYNGFSRQTLEAAFNAPYQEILRALLGGQEKQRGSWEGEQSQSQEQNQQSVIVRASREQIRQLTQQAQPSQQGGQSQSGPFNLRNLETRYSNNYGNFWEARANQFPQLRDLGVAVAWTDIKQGAWYLPHFNTETTVVAYIAQGNNGLLEVASPQRVRSEQGQEEQEQRIGQIERVTAQLNEGNVVVIPAGYPFSFRASNDNHLQIVGFGINDQNNQRNFLAGERDNVLNQIERTAKELTFSGTGEQVERLLRYQKQSYFVNSNAQPQQQGEGRGSVFYV